MTPALSLAGLSKAFGGVSAVDDVSFDIAAGEFFALLGPSGCGKTTLLRLIGGFERPDAGAIRIAGRDMAATPPHRRPTTMVFQSYALFPHLTVAGNVAFGLQQERLARAEIEARVAEALALVRLEGLGGRKPDQLSGGQRQRVALARAAVKRPQLLLLDEPLSALDRKLREETRAELTELQRRLGIAFVMVTHDQEEALAVADRIAVMIAGRVAQVGPPAEVYARPASRAVAQFLGDVNLIAATVLASDTGVLRLRLSDLEQELTAEGEAAPGQAVWLAVRPERMLLADDGISATVTGVVYLGNRWQVAARCGDATLIATLSDQGGPPAAVGSTVRFTWPAAAQAVLLR